MGDWDNLALVRSRTMNLETEDEDLPGDVYPFQTWDTLEPWQQETLVARSLDLTQAEKFWGKFTHVPPRRKMVKVAMNNAADALYNLVYSDHFKTKEEVGKITQQTLNAGLEPLYSEKSPYWVCSKSEYDAQMRRGTQGIKWWRDPDIPAGTLLSPSEDLLTPGAGMVAGMVVEGPLEQQRARSTDPDAYEYKYRVRVW